MAAPKGSHNNPNGRPPASRALTDLLRKSLNKTFDVGEEKKRSGKIILAETVVIALVTGRLRFPGDAEDSVLSVRDWIEFTKWAYTYLEPPIVPHELTGKDGGNVIIEVVYIDKLPKEDNA
jgi:hypothetical protein